MPHRPLTGLLLAAALVPAIAVAAPGKPPRETRAPAHLPSNAELTSRKAVAADAPKPAESDWRTPDPNNLLVIDTNKGRILVEMYPELAPAHVAQIQALAKKHFYDGQTFFRVIDGFMDQTGDPGNNGEGGSDLPNLKAEFTFKRDASTPFVVANTAGGTVSGFIGAMPVGSRSDDLMAMMADGKVPAWGLFCPGVAAMARAGDPDSANSQFFLMRATYSALTQKYTAWGRTLTGLDVVVGIKVGEPVAAPQDRMITVRLASDMPEADRPKIQVLDTHSAAFRWQLDKAIANDGSTFTVCDVPVPTRTK